MPKLTERPIWRALAAHWRARDAHLRNLFSTNPRRGEKYTLDAAGWYLDYSKQRVDDETLRLLLQLAEDAGVAARRDAMWRGEKINTTEQRAVSSTRR